MSISEQLAAALGEPDGETSAERTLDLLWALTRFTLPTVVVEAGTHHGHAALAIADALRSANPSGHVWTADTAESKVNENAEKLGLTNYVTFFRGDFLDMLPRVPDGVNFAYLDAGPDADGLRWRHLQGLLPKLAPGALVATDDVAGSWTKVEEFRALGYYFPQHRGLSLWQKPW